MIDYSILNPTKKIWLNLELYFESYEFYKFIEFFWNFFDFIYVYFRFLFNLNIKKNSKKWVFIAWAHVDATWHERPRGSATWTRAIAAWRTVARGTLYLIFYIYISYSSILYIGGPPCIRGQMINSLNASYLIYSKNPYYFPGVGLFYLSLLWL